MGALLLRGMGDGVQYPSQRPQSAYGHAVVREQYRHSESYDPGKFRCSLRAEK